MTPVLLCPPPEPRAPQPAAVAQCADYLLAAGRAGHLDMRDVRAMRLVQRRLSDTRSGCCGSAGFAFCKCGPDCSCECPECRC